MIYFFPPLLYRRPIYRLLPFLTLSTSKDYTILTYRLRKASLFLKREIYILFICADTTVLGMCVCAAWHYPLERVSKTPTSVASAHNTQSPVVSTFRVLSAFSPCTATCAAKVVDIQNCGVYVYVRNTEI